MSTSNHQSHWARLLRVACALIRQVNSPILIIDHWTLGGGTAMMLQIDHRESHDLDIFLRDPQLLAFLDPERHDFDFEILPSGHDGDGTKFLKIAFEDIGEIDFIVAQPKTTNSTIQRDVEGERILLETVPGIIVKKIVHRGSSLKPRDIFDIAAAGQQYETAIVSELRSYKAEVAAALDALARLNPQFVKDAVSQLQIRESFEAVAKTAMDRAKQILQAV